jgi:hypothetical protein
VSAPNSSAATLAKAQTIWAEAGGLGPAPEGIVKWVALKGVELDDHARATLERAVSHQRHKLRMRFIERAFPASLAHAYRAVADGEPLTIGDRRVSPNRWAADLVTGAADELLAVLVDEAKASAKEGAS